MKTILAAAAVAIVGFVAPTAHAADVGVSVNISQPGVYGRIDIGRFPQPQVIVQQPVIISRPAYVRPVEPVYMWVPPGHRKNWRKHCGAYNACGVPVYFVQDRWYDREVRSHHDERRDDRDDHRGDGRGKGHKDKGYKDKDKGHKDK